MEEQDGTSPKGQRRGGSLRARRRLAVILRVVGKAIGSGAACKAGSCTWDRSGREVLPASLLEEMNQVSKVTMQVLGTVGPISEEEEDQTLNGQATIGPVRPCRIAMPGDLRAIVLRCTEAQTWYRVGPGLWFARGGQAEFHALIAQTLKTQGHTVATGYSLCSSTHLPFQPLSPESFVDPRCAHDDKARPHLWCLVPAGENTGLPEAFEVSKEVFGATCHHKVCRLS